jgi:hypothetical protein
VCSSDLYSPLIAIEVFSPVAEAFKEGEGPISGNRVAAIAAAPETVTRELLDQFVKSGLLLEIESQKEGGAHMYMPARPLEDIDLLDILDAARASSAHTDSSSLVKQLLALHADKERELLTGIDSRVLVDEAHPGRRQLGLVASRLAAETQKAVEIADLGPAVAT